MRKSEEEQQNTYSHKTSGRQLKQNKYQSLPRQGVNKNRKNTKRCIIKQRSTQSPHKYSEVHQAMNQQQCKILYDFDGHLETCNYAQ